MFRHRGVGSLVAIVVLAAGSPAWGQLGVGPQGELLRDGKPYRGIGVNYFSCFLRTLASGDDRSYEQGFQTLAEKGIPFARFCAAGFWPRDMRLYQTDREEYFRRLDRVVEAAGKQGVGLIPSLFWYAACVPDLVGEPLDQWANPASKTRAWMRDYVREVVTRYRDNPTIWAWEFGNEYSLSANLPNAAQHRAKIVPALGTASARTERDDLTFPMVRDALAAFGEEARRHDPRRVVESGDSFLRPSAWHQLHDGNWKVDSPEQSAEILAMVNPAPVDVVSIHMYEDNDQRLVRTLEAARRLGKPVFVGEFGAEGQGPAAEAKFRRLLAAIVDHDVPLAALWVFDHPHQRDWTVTSSNARAWQLDAVGEANRRLRAGRGGAD